MLRSNKNAYATFTFQLLASSTSSSYEVTVLEFTFCELERLELVDLSHLVARVNHKGPS